MDEQTDLTGAAADAEGQEGESPRCGEDTTGTTGTTGNHGAGSDGNGNGDGARVVREEGRDDDHRAGNGRGTPLERAKRQLEVDPARLAKRLKAAREAKGWNRLELATRADVAPSTVSNLERQQSASPDPVVALALALALGYESVAGLLGDGPAASFAPEGPGPMTLEALVSSLLRGVWAAQGTRPAGRCGRAATGAEAGVETTGAAVSGLTGLTALGTTPVFVGAVFLLEPKTVG
jgi:transcriptional regulator with XRE-family HTH domain